MAGYKTADVLTMLADMGVDVTLGSETVKGLLDQPEEIDLQSASLAGIIGRRVVVTIRSATLTGITVGSAITAEGESFIVRAPLAVDDDAVKRLLCTSGTAAELLSGADLRAEPITPIALPFDPAAAGQGVGGSGDTYYGQGEIAQMFDELGVPVATATDATVGVIDVPEEIDLEVLDGLGGIIGAAVVITIQRATLPGITVQSTIVGAGIPYTIRAVLNDDDGAITRLLCTAGSTATPDPEPTGPLVVAHATQHNTDGLDPITDLNADVITTGTLALARGGTAADLSSGTALGLIRLNADRDALEDSGTTIDQLATDVEVTAAVSAHAGVSSAHHPRYTDVEAAAAAPVASVFGRAGAVVAASNDYTWAQINKGTSSLADIATRVHSALQTIGVDDHHARDHQATHGEGAADPLKLDDLAAPDDNTDLDSTITVHGLLPKLVNDASKFLNGVGAWSVPPSDVAGPAGATDNAITRYDGVTGKLIQDSLAIVDDAGNISVPALATVDGVDISEHVTAASAHDDFNIDAEGLNWATIVGPTTLKGAVDQLDTQVTQLDLGKLQKTGDTITGNISVDALVTIDGRDISVDGVKLDGIEIAATADQTAAEILTAIKTVDGTGSGLDADTVDGIEAAAFLQLAGGTMSGKITATGQVISVGNIEHDNSAASAFAVILALPISTSSYVTLTGSEALTTIGGIANGVDGRVVTIINDAATVMVLSHEDVASAAADRIDTLSGADQSVRKYDSISLRYKGSSSRWEVIKDGIHGLFDDTQPFLTANMDGQGFELNNILLGASTAKDAKVLALDVAGVMNLNGNTVLGAGFGPPDARLTLTSGVPFLSSDVTAATAIYYTPYQGDTIPIPATTGGAFGRHTFTELTLTLNVTNYLSGKNYDVFVFFDPADETTIIAGTSGAWTNDTTRADALGLVEGMDVNNAAVTMRNDTTTYSVGAKDALFVGSFRCSANGQTEMTMRPAAAAGGPGCKLFLRNRYNRIKTTAVSRPNENNWTYTTDTWREWNASTTMRIQYIVDLDEGFLQARAEGAAINTGAGRDRLVAVGYDSSTAIADGAITAYTGGGGMPANCILSLTSELGRSLELGYHYVSPLERSEAGGTCLWYGVGGTGASVRQTGFSLTLDM